MTKEDVLRYICGGARAVNPGIVRQLIDGLENEFKKSLEERLPDEVKVYYDKLEDLLNKIDKHYYEMLEKVETFIPTIDKDEDVALSICDRALEINNDGTVEINKMGITDLSIATKAYVDNSRQKFYQHNINIACANDKKLKKFGFDVNFVVVTSDNDVVHCQNDLNAITKAKRFFVYGNLIAPNGKDFYPIKSIKKDQFGCLIFDLLEKPKKLNSIILDDFIGATYTDEVIELV